MSQTTTPKTTAKKHTDAPSPKKTPRAQNKPTDQADPIGTRPSAKASADPRSSHPSKASAEPRSSYPSKASADPRTPQKSSSQKKSSYSNSPEISAPKRDGKRANAPEVPPARAKAPSSRSNAPKERPTTPEPARKKAHPSTPLEDRSAPPPKASPRKEKPSPPAQSKAAFRPSAHEATDSPDTIQDTPRASHPKKAPSNPSRPSYPQKAPSKRSFLTTPQRWTRLDRWLTALALCSILGLIGVVYGVNHWAGVYGAEKLHPLSVYRFSDRLSAFFSYIAWNWGPPQEKSTSLGYEKEILAAALHAGLAPHLLKAMIQKNSSFRPHHISADGAMGLMQVTPTMAREIKHKDNLFVPSSNLRAGAGYLRLLLTQTSLPEALRHYRQASCPSCVQPSLVVRRGYAEHVLDLSRRFARDPGQQIRRQARANRRLRPQKTPADVEEE